MEEYYNLFVELCLQQCTGDNFMDKKMIGKSNRAARKLETLKAKMSNLDIKEILQRLLLHEDERVKVNAATFCFQIRVLVEQAVPVFKELLVTAGDPSIRITADLLLGQELGTSTLKPLRDNYYTSNGKTGKKT